MRLLWAAAWIIGMPGLIALIVWQETRPSTQEDLRREIAIFERWRTAADRSADLDNLVGLCQSARKTDRIASELRNRDRIAALLDIGIVTAAARIAARCDELKVPSRYRLDEMKSNGRRNTADRLVGVEIP